MDESTRAEITKAIEERLERQGAEEKVEQVVERKPGQVFVYTKRRGENEQRVGAFSVEELLG